MKGLPEVVMFEGLGPCYYELGPMRPPRDGEYYLSGAIVAGWKAYGDLESAYRIATPTHKAVSRVGYAKGERLTLSSGGVS